MIFSVDVRRAHKGDCLLLHFGTEEDPGLILIDGGPADVYKPQLRPRLEEIRQMRHLSADAPLRVDLLMVSHVDDDHIHGILDLTAGMRDGTAPALQVMSFWHNSFDNIVANDTTELTANFKQHVVAAGDTGTLPKDATIDADDPNLDEEAIVSSLKVLASIAQGARLRLDTEALNFELNPEFDGKLIFASAERGPIHMGKGLTLTVVGPMLPEIKALQTAHRKWLEDLTKQGKSPEEALAAYVDKSVPNLSSVVVLAEVDDKKVLLTGDARGDKILAGLEFVGAMERNGKLDVELLKVPHHGSANNLGEDFFERITAKHYVFSGDGEHGNPEREALQMLVDARGEHGYTVHLTYPIEIIDRGRKEDREIAQAKEKKKAKEVRENWSEDKHSLKAFFATHKNLAKNVKVVPGNKPHVINLGDPIG
jgi:hypothetical protein